MNNASRQNRLQPRLRVAVVLLAAACLTSCLVEHHVRPVPTEEMLPWLRPGTTSRDELLQILGSPRRSLEAGGILMWELQDNGYQTPEHDGPWGRMPGPLSLVVVVDGERVQRASLVRLWQ
jgi:hypothetical protein